MSRAGTISFKSKDKSGHFNFAFIISDYHAAQIVQYIAQIPHATVGSYKRDGKGKYAPITASDLKKGTYVHAGEME